MKKLFTTGFLFLFSLTAFTQVGLSTEIVIGRNLKTKSEIKAKEYVFSDIISSWQIDDSTKILTLQLRGNENDGKNLKDIGDLVSFDLKTNSVVWQKKINYLNSTVDQYNNLLIKTTDNQSSCLNNDDGESLWESKNTISYVNPKLKIGVGYKNSPSNDLTSRLEGIDLVTGKKIWKREINRDFGVNDILILNDSVILIVANGIHLVMLKNGNGWDYDSKTGRKDYSATVAVNVFNFVLSLILGSQSEIYTDHDVYTDMTSNLLVDSSGIYMADKSSLVRLDLQGQIIWKSNLPAGMSGKSSIFMKNSTIYMINYGFAYMNGQLVNYGKPYVAAFERNTGNQLYSNIVGYKKDKLSAFSIQHDTLFLLSKNRIFKFSLKSGFELWEQNFKTDSVGELTKFADADMYIKTDSTYSNLYFSDTTKVYVYTDKNNLLILNNELKPVKSISVNDIYYCYLETNEYRFLENRNTTIVIDKSGQEIANLNISGNVTLRGNRLFEVEENSLIEFNINQLNQNQ